MNPNRVNANLAGYCDRMYYRAGEDVGLHLHGRGRVEIDLVRLNAADDRVTVCQPEETAVSEVPSLTVDAELQEAFAGSYVILDDFAPDFSEGFSVCFWMYPTYLGEAAQGIVSTFDREQGGFALTLEKDGTLALTDCNGRTAGAIDAPLLLRHWSKVKLRCAGGAFSLSVETRSLSWAPQMPLLQRTEGRIPKGMSSVSGRLLMAATRIETTASGTRRPSGCFNGKLEGLTVFSHRGGEEVCEIEWDFAQDISSNRAVDVSGNGRHGTVVAGPTRGVTGASWTGEQVDFRFAPEQFAAIHFHEDDLEDAGWPLAATVSLPDDLASGIYALRIISDDGEDRVPVLVQPGLKSERNKVAFLVPTFNYLAYANAFFYDRIDYVGTGMSGRALELGPRDQQLRDLKAYRGSVYDLHSDGSGRCYSSYKRPLLNMRADYRSALQHTPRHFSGDLYLTGWLDYRGYDYDILTDHALDDDAALLEGYRVLITGSHPEYWSGAMLDRLEAFMRSGGRVMYLGGNGFYWVTARAPGKPHVIEVRRGHNGVRSWSSEPGECNLSSTGEPGGLWRNRGRTPHRLLGIGMAGQGTDDHAPGFRKTPEAELGEYAWVFDGVDNDVFGEFGFAMGGASGDELDRYDRQLGSPAHVTVLASSLPHSKFYKVAIEDVEMIADGLDGEHDERVRSDIVIFRTAGGGQVFSVGSIAWAAALAWNNFDNEVERVTRNVLDNFLN